MREKHEKINNDFFEVIESAKNLDQQSFSFVYENFATPIYRYLFVRTGSKQLSEDLMQTVFLKAWENKEVISQKDNSLAWLYTIAKNTLIDYWRKKKEVLTDKIELSEEVADENLEGELENRLHLQKIVSVLNSLSEDQKDVITMKFFDELSNKEIEEITKKSATAVRSLQYRALMEIKKVIDKSANEKGR